MAKRLSLKIVTPSRMVYDGGADMVILRGACGDMGILPGHESRAAVLGYGPLRIFNEGAEESEIAVMGGAVEIFGDRVTVLSEAAELPGDIDRVRAEAAKSRAEQRLLQKGTDTDMQRAELSLRRALVRIEVSSYPLIRGRK